MSAMKRSNGDFRVPERLVKVSEDLDKWTKSQVRIYKFDLHKCPK